MENKKAEKRMFTFHIDEERFFVTAETPAAAMVKMNRDVVDKRNLHPMAWFGHDDNKNIPEKTYVLQRGNFFD